MKGQRLLIEHDGTFSLPMEPGEYVGPVQYGEDMSVLFLLPMARDDGVDPQLRSVCRVTSPPHEWTEEDDGSLTIHGSIGIGHGPGFLWHGYLRRGEWVEA